MNFFNVGSYPGGMLMPGRRYAATTKYRYGFNGKENDNDVKGEGNQQDYGMRIYDPRLGRFLSVDPITNEYPELTPYQFASNRPIDGIDMDGLEWYKKIIYLICPIVGASTDKDIREGFTKRAVEYVHGLSKLPAVVQQFVDSYGTLATPGIPYINQQQKKQNAFNNALAQGAIASGKELFELAKTASKGDKKAIGALGFELAMLVAPGGEEMGALRFGTKELKSLGQIIPIAEKTILNSNGKSVTRFLVKNENDLLKVAEDAAGGSLDNLPNKSGNVNGTWWEGDVNGTKTKIEWEPGGHQHTNEGPHVRVQKWIEGAGKKGKGKWSNGEKYFIQGKEAYKKP